MIIRSPLGVRATRSTAYGAFRGLSPLDDAMERDPVATKAALRNLSAAVQGIILQLSDLGGALADAQASNGTDQTQSDIENWNRTEGTFIEGITQFVARSDPTTPESQAKWAEWKKLAQGLVTNAQQIQKVINDGTLGRRIFDLLGDLPGAFDEALTRFLNEVGHIAGVTVAALVKPAEDAALGLSTVALIVGGAAALILFGFKKAGVKANIGPASLGGYRSRCSKREERAGACKRRRRAAA